MAITAWTFGYNPAAQPQPVKRPIKFGVSQAAPRPTTGQLWPIPKS